MKIRQNNFSELNGSLLTITQPAFFKRSYEIKFGDDLIATIRLKGFFESTAELEIFHERFEIYKPSIWKSKLEIRKQGYELPFASYSEKFFSQSGTVTLPKGEKVIFNQPFFKRDIEAKTEKEIELFSIRNKFSLKDSAEITINNKAELLNKYPWLIVIGWLLVLEKKRRAAHS